MSAACYLIGQGLLLNSGLLLGLLKSQTQLFLDLCIPTKSCFFSLTGSASICLVKLCELPDNRDAETRRYYRTVCICKVTDVLVVVKR